jgi:hypothetical protein
MNPLSFMASVAAGISLMIGALTAIFPTPQPPAPAAAITTTPPQATLSLVEAPKPVPQYEPAPRPTCDDYVDLARTVGWPETELGTVAQIMWAESRCQADAVGDITRGVSLGLMQIHTESWCEPTRYWPLGYLQTKAVLDYCQTLLDPYVNLYAALVIWQEGGWQQWTTYKGQ